MFEVLNKSTKYKMYFDLKHKNSTKIAKILLILFIILLFYFYEHKCKWNIFTELAQCMAIYMYVWMYLYDCLEYTDKQFNN